MAEHPAAIAVIPGLPPEVSARLLALLSAEPAVQEVWLYGSRAMGRHCPGSDIDLTLVAPDLRHDDRLRLMGALDDLLLPWSIDLSLHHECPNRCVSTWPTSKGTWNSAIESSPLWCLRYFCRVQQL